MLEKIKSNIVYIAKNITDLRVLGQVVFVVIVLLMSWSCIKSIQANYDLQKHISRIEQENVVKQLENENLDLSNKYLQTDEYLELAARKAFGKAAPGETVVLVPKKVALANTVDVAKPVRQINKAQIQASKSFFEQNFEAWLNFFRHQSG